MIPPIISKRSGTTLSTCHPQIIAITMKTPPYAAYTLPKFAGWNVATIPYRTKIIPPKIAIQKLPPSRNQSHIRYPPPISQKPASIKPSNA